MLYWPILEVKAKKKMGVNLLPRAISSPASTSEWLPGVADQVIQLLHKMIGDGIIANLRLIVYSEDIVQLNCSKKVTWIRFVRCPKDNLIWFMVRIVEVDVWFMVQIFEVDFCQLRPKGTEVRCSRNIG